MLNHWTRCIGGAAVLLACSTALADNWQVNMTVDNQFDCWFGTPTTTNFHAGTGNSWPTTYTFTAFGRLPTDYVYVSTSSDHAVAQGFIGDFTNTTTNMSTVTGDAVWEVFPAGAHLQQINPNWPAVWPANQQPTQSEVDQAIAYAQTNSLWETPDGSPTPSFNGAAPWGPRPGISATAQWIWHQAPGGPIDPLHGGYNHDEFLVFRIAGASPAPASGALLILGGVVAARRRRA